MPNFNVGWLSSWTDGSQTVYPGLNSREMTDKIWSNIYPRLDIKVISEHQNKSIGENTLSRLGNLGFMDIQDYQAWS